MSVYRGREPTATRKSAPFAPALPYAYHDRRVRGRPGRPSPRGGGGGGGGEDVWTATKLFGFTAVDQTGDAAFFIRFLDEAGGEPSVQAYNRHRFTLLDARPGRSILEIGCGTGDDARTLAALVRPDGEVIAVDSSDAMLVEARRRSEGSALPVRFERGDALHLDFADASFGGCRCDRTFMHLEDPRRALREMVRVTRPGGRVVVYEVDFETVVIDAPDRTTARKVVNAWCDGFRDGWLGRRIPRLFHDAGLRDVAVSAETLHLTYGLAAPMVGPATVDRAVAAGALTAEEAEGWLRWFAETAEVGRLFCTLTGFLVAGTKA